MEPPFFHKAEDWLQLFKPQLALWVLWTTATGFCLGSRGELDVPRLCALWYGVALVAFGAAALNQWVERERDVLMERTRVRPLPAGRMPERTAWVAGVVFVLGGLTLLAIGTAVSVVLLTGVALGLYLAGYTPLKKKRSFLILPLGALVGALLPGIGWAAVGGGLCTQSILLCGVLFFWQMPHLSALAWLHRGDYTRAGFFALGWEAQKWGDLALLCTMTLSVLTPLLAKAVSGSGVCLTAVLGCNALFLFCAGAFRLQPGEVTARRLFLASIAYLPAVLGLMVLGRFRVFGF